MKKTMKYLECGNMIRVYLELIVEICVSYSQYLCYFFMIASMMKNAGLISLFFPFVTFGYSIMEETTPTKKFWYMILIYTESLILIKFIFQLEFWDALFYETTLTNIENGMVI
jgi:hypothetical protein